MAGFRAGESTARLNTEGYQLKQRTAHVAVTRDDRVFNLQLAAHERSELSINVHTELKDRDGQENAVRAALDACHQFIPLREEAVELASQIIGLELER
jgi:hypothetical protein